MEFQTFFQMMALAVGIACVYTDARFGFIPNRITLPAIAFGLTIQLVVGGPLGLSDAAGGALLGLGLLLLPVLLKGMGAGDAKLLAALGSLAGPGMVFSTFVFSSILGGVVAFYLLFAKYVWPGGASLPLAGWNQRIPVTAGASPIAGFPFAACIFFGFIITLTLGRPVTLQYLWG